MTCNDARRLLPAYFDGELDLVRAVEVEGHLQDCGECSRQIQAQKALRDAVRSSSPGFAAPPGLDRRVLAAVQRESRASADAATKQGLPRWGWQRVYVPILAFAAVAAIAFVLSPFARFDNGGRRASLADEAISSHVRSLQASHLFDVASTDQHTVKPWFAGKLDFSPPVVDLVDRGYPLTGGRLDYLEGHPVAALVYRKKLHVINLFVWPASSGATPESLDDRRGYHVVQWTGGGMVYCAVSDVNSADLREFCGLVSQPVAGP